AENTVATHLFRIAQEATSNAVKHGAAQNISIELDCSSTDVILVIRDDGRGFIPRDDSSGMGLRIMSYRAGMIGGSVEVQSTEGQGTKVICTVPFSEVQYIPR